MSDKQGTPDHINDIQKEMLAKQLRSSIKGSPIMQDGTRTRLINFGDTGWRDKPTIFAALTREGIGANTRLALLSRPHPLVGSLNPITVAILEPIQDPTTRDNHTHTLTIQSKDWAHAKIAKPLAKINLEDYSNLITINTPNSIQSYPNALGNMVYYLSLNLGNTNHSRVLLTLEPMMILVKAVP